MSYAVAKSLGAPTQPRSYEGTYLDDWGMRAYSPETAAKIKTALAKLVVDPLGDRDAAAVVVARGDARIVGRPLPESALAWVDRHVAAGKVVWIKNDVPWIVGKVPDRPYDYPVNLSDLENTSVWLEAQDCGSSSSGPMENPAVLDGACRRNVGTDAMLAIEALVAVAVVGTAVWLVRRK